tara:strand:+ start:1882 stop:2535 length:654 start_codon:yes stop_codon:yes gene_type:complete
MPTKADLEATISELEHDVRRLSRSLGQAKLDLQELPERLVNYPRPQRSEQSSVAIDRALAEWSSTIEDPDQRINTYIRSMEGIGWTWEKEYVKNGQFAWCGAFAAFCYRAVKFKTRQKIFPSCYRLYSNWSQTSRKIEPRDMLPGDIVVVYSSARATWGDHITLCRVAPIDGRFETLEGNAHGTLGDGSHGEGVIARERSLDEVAFVYRLLAEDFDE